MAKGIAITITRPLVYRKKTKDDACSHAIWNGVKWVSLEFPVWKPQTWEIGRQPEIVTTRLEFLPSGVVSYNPLAYRKGLMVKECHWGVIR